MCVCVPGLFIFYTHTHIYIYIYIYALVSVFTINYLFIYCVCLHVDLFSIYVYRIHVFVCVCLMYVSVYADHIREPGGCQDDHRSSTETVGSSTHDRVAEEVPLGLLCFRALSTHTLALRAL